MRHAHALCLRLSAADKRGYGNWSFDDPVFDPGFHVARHAVPKIAKRKQHIALITREPQKTMSCTPLESTGSPVIEKTRQSAGPHSQPPEHGIATLAPCLELLPCQRKDESDSVALEKGDAQTPAR